MKLSIINCQLSIFLLLATLNACKEIGPDINLHGNANAVADTTYLESPAVPELKNAVLEEFTGVHCVNCPQGHQVIENIQAANPNRVIAVGLYPSNTFSGDVNVGAPQENLTNPKATALLSYFGWPGFEPIGAVDRKLFSGQTSILVDRQYWTSFVSQELAQATPVNLLLTKTFDSTNRQLTIVAELHYTQNVTEQNKLTIVLTEDSLVTAQLDGNAIDTFYAHNNVTRDFITDTQGDLISDSTQAGRVVRKVYRTVLDAAWKPENMNIIAFVHEFQNAKTVYQGKEIRLAD